MVRSKGNPERNVHRNNRSLVTDKLLSQNTLNKIFLKITTITDQIWQLENTKKHLRTPQNANLCLEKKIGIAFPEQD